jgi:hypothetical protein
MKIFNDALKKHGNNLTLLHEDIIKRGFSVSRVTLWKLQHGRIKSIKPNILAVLVDIAYNGDWEKAGKAIKSDN